jgi:hypothetical protein
VKNLLLGGLLLLATLPATSNYRLNSFGFGSGGTASSTTTTYSLEGISGEANGAPSSTTSYSLKPGFIQTQQANVPQLSDLDNDSGIYYNQLHFILDNQNNPTDATFLISVSTDNFATNTTYVQPDGTLSSTLSTSDYQTYANWGGSSGSSIIGLLPNTTYYVRARATQGKFSESAYGPISTQATAAESITFSLQTSTQPTPPYTVSLGTLTAGIIATSSQTINTSLSTNGAEGANVYLTGKNGGLLSSSTGNLISAVSNDLSTLNDGFGAQSSSVSQSAGGPWSVVSPYNGTGNNVGIISAITRSLYDSSDPVSSGTGTLVLKAKSATTDVAASDYQETLTFTAAANF